MSRAARALLALVAALASAFAARADDVDVALVRMGVGNHVRAGDPTAILVRVTSGLQAPVQARIEWSVRNADGDVARYARDAALAPGAPVERWIYGVAPIVSASAQATVDLVTTVRVVETQDGRAVRVLAEKRIDGTMAEDPAVAVETTESLVGIVGDGRAGLAGISTPTPNLGSSASSSTPPKSSPASRGAPRRRTRPTGGRGSRASRRSCGRTRRCRTSAASSRAPCSTGCGAAGTW